MQLRMHLRVKGRLLSRSATYLELEPNRGRFTFTMNYKTVFEVGFKSIPWGQLLHPVFFILLGVLLVRFGRRRQFYQVAGGIAVTFASLFLLLGLTPVQKYIELRHAYRSGNSSVVEGVVENFHPAPDLGIAAESFSVRGVDFSYSALDSTPCFHDAPIHKGPIRSALAVRIYYKDGCIQRGEIRE